MPHAKQSSSDRVSVPPVNRPAEKRLLAQHAGAIASQFPAGGVVLELGCGDCSKTALLLQALLDRWVEWDGRRPPGRALGRQ